MTMVPSNSTPPVMRTTPPGGLSSSTPPGLPTAEVPPPQPQGLLRIVLQAEFGGIDAFRMLFEQAAVERFGSGWAWLAIDDKGNQKVFSTPNHDSSLMLGLRPILGLPLWEHAYWPQYGPDRHAYVGSFWHLVNWARVAELYTLNIELINRARHRDSHLHP